MSGAASLTGPAGGANAARRRRQTAIAWTFAAPFVIIFAMFMVLPIAASLGFSFTDLTAQDVRTPFNVDVVGLRQYADVLTDPRFQHAAGVTAVFVLAGIPLTVALGLALALALNSGVRRFKPVYRVAFYAPVVTSVVAVSVIWRHILARDGLLNMLLALVGVQGPDWLNSTTWALPSLVLMAVWRNAGTLMVIFLAGLQSIPPAVMEAAAMDGAGPWRRLRSVTLPLLRPAMLLGGVLISVGYLQFFEESFVMTQGGPLESTLSLTYYTFNTFGFGDFAKASAASYLMFVVIAAVSLVQFRLLRRAT
ncbi:sugar ABC transporter permease [Actinomadura sp. ATCC 31491]|uniref:Sugar ABC transporter permease n=1 Tax=Actinomadura luzonensis TaxID=2805427 RepID=A0ABT0FUN3_9ACTN|nr:sugar ABC transporter permease [Actinomadura luzonensis]MCK2216040.1 sugar ABC transporter permease [Actinomadura luzonensis]